jgi:predicted nucleic acid-binding Zn ribbon protein
VPALQFKGSGWYVTDYGKGNGVSAREKTSADEKKASEKSASQDSKSTSSEKSSSSKGEDKVKSAKAS